MIIKYVHISNTVIRRAFRESTMMINILPDTPVLSWSTFMNEFRESVEMVNAVTSDFEFISLEDAVNKLYIPLDFIKNFFGDSDIISYYMANDRKKTGRRLVSAANVKFLSQEEVDKVLMNRDNARKRRDKDRERRKKEKKEKEDKILQDMDKDLILPPPNESLRLPSTISPSTTSPSQFNMYPERNSLDDFSSADEYELDLFNLLSKKKQKIHDIKNTIRINRKKIQELSGNGSSSKKSPKDTTVSDLSLENKRLLLELARLGYSGNV